MSISRQINVFNESSSRLVESLVDSLFRIDGFLRCLFSFDSTWLRGGT